MRDCGVVARARWMRVPRTCKKVRGSEERPDTLVFMYMNTNKKVVGNAHHRQL